jgi:hypothetical protein
MFKYTILLGLFIPYCMGFNCQDNFASVTTTSDTGVSQINSLPLTFQDLLPGQSASDEGIGYIFLTEKHFINIDRCFAEFYYGNGCRVQSTIWYIFFRRQ